MKKVVFKNRLKKERKKRSVSINEVFDRGRYHYALERRLIFRLKEIRTFEDTKGAAKWIDKRLLDDTDTRRLWLLSVCNKNRGQKLWQSKLSDKIYIMHNKVVLTVLFLQVVKVAVQKRSLLAQPGV